eukprot:ANDGO_02611.mRNA.1 tRNA (guanine-N(7)-)-methyltransferase non-catalytic subunit wuho
MSERFAFVSSSADGETLCFGANNEVVICRVGSDEACRLRYSFPVECTAAALSQCGTLVFVCTDDKTVHCLRYSITEAVVEPVCSRDMERKCSHLECPAHDPHTLLALDRKGNVYAYRIPQMDQVKLLLGHIPIVNDFCLASKNFVVTVDRDGKTRVSHYPNSFVVQTYCLDSKSAVVVRCAYDAVHDILVTANIDGDIVAWDYRTGVELGRRALNRPIQVLGSASGIVWLSLEKSQELLGFRWNGSDSCFQSFAALEFPSKIYRLCSLKTKAFALGVEPNSVSVFDVSDTKITKIAESLVTIDIGALHWVSQDQKSHRKPCDENRKRSREDAETGSDEAED